MVHDSDKQSLSELERGGKLLLQLPYAIHPLDEDGRSVRIGMTLVAVANPLLYEKQH